MVGRRATLMGLGSALASWPLRDAHAAAAGPEPGPQPEDLVARDLRLKGTLSKRMLLFRPRYAPRDAKLPLLVLLHGLGETIDETLGVRAWVDRYGLGGAFDRLRRPPVVRTFAQRKDFDDAHLGRVNADLSTEPFYGFVIACPYTPKLTGGPDVDGFARWLVESLLPTAREEGGAIDDVRFTALDGVSLGGHLAFESFARHPEAWGAVGGVQSAISEAAAPGYATRLVAALERSGPRRLRIATSTEDVFRKGNERLASELARRNVASDLAVHPGWHDQPWLREVGTLAMLLWHDRRFHGARRPLRLDPWAR